MRSSGEYKNRLTHYVRSITPDVNTNQDIESFEIAEKKLWAKVEMNNSRRQTDYGAMQTGADLTIYIRNYPTVSALDRLYSAEYDETYIIESIYRGDNELVCDCHKFDSLHLQEPI